RYISKNRTLCLTELLHSAVLLQQRAFCNSGVSVCLAEGRPSWGQHPRKTIQMIRNRLCLFVLSGLLALAATGVRADDTALLDVLVKKGILTQKEADKLAAEASKEPVQSQSNGPQSRIKIGDWVQELNLYGDMRFRESYSTFQQQLPPVGPAFDKNIQR